MLTIWVAIGIIGLFFLFGTDHNKNTFSIRFSVNNYTLSIDTLLYLVSVFFVSILMTANADGYDAKAFNRFYYYVYEFDKNPYDYTYEFLSKIILLTKKVVKGLSYPQFHAVMVILLFFFLIKPVIQKYSVNYVALFFLYVLSGTFATDGMQFKGFIAVAFFVYAMSFIVDKEKDYKKFYIFMTISVLFHFSFMVYFLIPLINMLVIKRNIKILPYLGLTIYLLLFALGRTFYAGLLSLIAHIPFLSKVAAYDLSYSGIKSIVPVFIYFVILFILYILKTDMQVEDESRELYIENILNIWQFMGIVLPALNYVNAVYRLYRNVYLLIFIYILIALSSMPRGSIIRLRDNVMVIAMCVLLFIYPILLHQQVDIYLPILNGEYFWNEKIKSYYEYIAAKGY